MKIPIINMTNGDTVCPNISMGLITTFGIGMESELKMSPNRTDNNKGFFNKLNKIFFTLGLSNVSHSIMNNPKVNTQKR